MRRRDFNRMALGIGLGSSVITPAAAQDSAAKSRPTGGLAAPTVINTGRTYNQLPLPRKYAQGQRRFSVYWAWNYPWEANRDVSELDNRFSTMTEVRRVEWPFFEKTEYNERMVFLGNSGKLGIFHPPLLR